MSLGALGVFPGAAQAAIRTFDHGAGTDEWAGTANKNNWSGDVVPVTGDEAVIDSTYIPAGGTFTLGAASITTGVVVFNANQSLNLFASGATNRTLTLDGTSDHAATIAAGGSATDLLVVGRSVVGRTVTIGGTNASGGSASLLMRLQNSGSVNVVDATTTLNLITTHSPPSGGGTIALSKKGAGTLMLSTALSVNVDSFTVASGTLKLGINSALTTGTDLILGGGTFDTNGFNELQGSGTLELTGSSTIDLGSGASAFKIGNSSAVSWDAGSMLSIVGWSGLLTGGGTDQFAIGTTALGITPTQLAQIQFINPDSLPAGSYSATQLGTGEIVPFVSVVPEPASSLFVMVAGIALTHRRPRV